MHLGQVVRKGLWWGHQSGGRFKRIQAGYPVWMGSADVAWIVIDLKEIGLVSSGSRFMPQKFENVSRLGSQCIRIRNSGYSQSRLELAQANRDGAIWRIRRENLLAFAASSDRAASPQGVLGSLNQPGYGIGSPLAGTAAHRSA